MTDTIETCTPAVDNSVALNPTRTRVNPSSVEVAEGQALYVTSNEAGRIRALLTNEGAYEVGSTFEAKLGARKASLGTLTIVGLRTASAQSGDLPDSNVPLRTL